MMPHDGGIKHLAAAAFFIWHEIDVMENGYI
jgi:hypothetical protein